ncbi:MAG: peptidoglycan editing factor PgeF [Bacillota bacterium]|nr:peptidoglycan editing factor PgeF [Bacillota bacterium]MDW7677406.1 peptidoglycan editing factor PgeF [Bacillota bacterium]
MKNDKNECVFEWQQYNKVKYGWFPVLAQKGLITHGFSTRLGGVSKGDFSTMNLAYNSGDDPESVKENYRRFTTALGVDRRNAVLTHQTHQSRIRQVSQKDKGKGLLIPRDYHSIDGLMTNEPEIVLMSFHADCIPLYLIDPVQRAVGMGHAGWRGTVENLAGKMIRKMVRAYGTNPKNVLAGIGPSIHACCFLIREDVKRQMLQHLPFTAEHMRQVNKDQWSLSLQAVNRQLLWKEGVPDSQIFSSGVCTCCQHNLLFSHRKQGEKRGTMAALIQINNQT